MMRWQRLFGHFRCGRIRKHSVIVGGHKTSIALEDVFWRNLKAIAFENGFDTSTLVSEIDMRREDANLSSAIRQFILAQHLERWRTRSGLTQSDSPLDRSQGLAEKPAATGAQSQSGPDAARKGRLPGER